MKNIAQQQLMEVTSIEWATPWAIFDPLHAEFHFTVDVCANEHNAKLPPGTW